MSDPIITKLHCGIRSSYLRAQVRNWAVFLFESPEAMSPNYGLIAFGHQHENEHWSVVRSEQCVICKKKIPIDINYYLRRYLSKVKDYKGALELHVKAYNSNNS